MSILTSHEARTTESGRSLPAPVPTFDEASAQRYLAAGLWTAETFGEFFAERAARYGDALALVAPDSAGVDHRLSYRELQQRVQLTAGRLRLRGVSTGDRVVLALGNQVEFVEVLFATFQLGALPVFALPSHRERELSQFAQVADAALIVLGGSDAQDLYQRTCERIAEMPDPITMPGLLRAEELATIEAEPVTAPQLVAASDIAFLQLSGGTTGVSKLIPRTHRDYLYSVRASAEICELDATSRMLITLPVAHNFPMSSPGILGIFQAGGAVVLAADPSPRTAFRLITTESVTHAPLVPPLAQAWISAAKRRQPDLSTLKVVQVGGAKLSPTIAAEITPVLGARLQQVFGMAEGLVCYTRSEDPEDLVLRSQGRPICDFDEVRIVSVDDPDEPEVAEGEEGALLTRGPYTIRGYYRLDHRHAENFTADGFYRTGDLVRRLPTGHLVVTGRAKDQINRGGEKVATEEIEDLLLAHPLVFDALALGLPDRHLGERVVAVVAPEPGASAPAEEFKLLGQQLRVFLAEAGLADWKVPEEIHIIDSFPATHVGKNSRRDLRAALVAQLSQHNPEAGAE